MDEYCENHKQEEMKLPASQLLLHKERKVAFCYVPKSACTTFKILLLHSQGLLPDKYLNYDKYKQPHVAPQLRRITLNSVSPAQHNDVIRDYFKYMMFRHPLERLISGYRSKMSAAVNRAIKITDDDERDVEGNYLLNLKKDLLSKLYPVQYKKWEASRESYPLNITFSDFVDYWLTSKSLSNNDHFSPITRLCKPCLVRYNYYGNFKTFEKDTELLIDKIGALENELRPQYAQPSDKLAHQYFSQLNVKQKEGIVKNLALDLELYYTLFPPERDSHKTMLGIETDI